LTASLFLLDFGCQVHHFSLNIVNDVERNSRKKNSMIPDKQLIEKPSAGWKRQARKPSHDLVSSVRSPKNYGRVKSVEQLQEFVDRLLADGKPVGFDIETGYDGPDRAKAALHPQEGFVVGFSFTNSVSWARYVPLRHDIADNFSPYDVARIIWPLCNSGLIVAHQVKFEISFMAPFFRQYLPDNEEVQASGGTFPFYDDSMLMAYAEASEPFFGLKALTKSIFGHDQASIETLFPTGLKKNKLEMIRFNALELSAQVVEYACEDAVWTLALAEHFRGLLDAAAGEGKSANRKRIYELEKRVVPVLLRMEETGVRFDWSAIDQLREEALAFSDLLRDEIYDLIEERVGKRVAVNFNSPKQVSELYYVTLKLPIITDPKTGNPTTNAKALTALAAKDVIVDRIMRWKEVQKLIGSYLTKYLRDYRYAADGNAHPSYNQVRVASGRFATSDPNTQQLPAPLKIELSDGKVFSSKFRNFIIAPDDFYILGFDFSQQELRVLAGMAKETAMIKAFDADVDVHTLAASRIYAIDTSEVTKEQRQTGKLFAFSILYGQGISATAAKLNKSRDEAEELLSQYFSSFPGVRTWMDETVAQAWTDRYVDTYFGRRIDLPQLASTDSWMVAHGERLSVNATIQGTAADLTKIAMVNCMSKIDELDLTHKVRMVMNIHDALEFYVHESIDPFALSHILRPVVELRIPGFPRFASDWHHGSKWGSVEEIPFEDYSNRALFVEESSDLDVVVSPPSPLQVTDAPEGPMKYVIKCSYDPSREQWERWSQWLQEHPGDNPVVYEIPSGTLEGSVTAQLDLSAAADVSLIFTGAQLFLHQDYVADFDLLFDEERVY